MKILRVYITIFLLFGFFVKPAELIAQEELVVIINTNVPIETIKKEQLKDIYLGDLTIWKNKSKIKPCYMADLEDFWDDVVEMNSAKFKGYWTKKVFSGYGTSPAKFTNDESIIKYVERIKGGIGVINKSSSSNLTANCKVISIH